MRCNQYQGLTEEAENFLSQNVKRTPVKVCKECGAHSGGTKYEKHYKSYFGMYDEEFPLMKYTLNDETKVKEVVQASPWSSGPVIFLCLEKENGERMFEWPQEEIDHA